MASTRRIEWSFQPADSRTLRLLSYCSFGVIGGMGVFAVFLLGTVLLRGSLVTSGLLAAALLFSVFVWTTHLRPLVEEADRLAYLDRRWLLLASLLGAGAFYLTLDVGRALGFLLLFGLIAVPAVLVSAFESEGDIDSDARTMTYRGREIPLDGLSGVRRLRLGGLTAHWFSYVSGAESLTTPRFVVLPSTVAEEAEPVLTTAIEAEASEHHRPNPAVRYALAAFGLVFLGFTAFLVLAMPEGSDAAVVETYAVLVFGLMGVGFLGAAAVHD